MNILTDKQREYLIILHQIIDKQLRYRDSNKLTIKGKRLNEYIRFNLKVELDRINRILHNGTYYGYETQSLNSLEQLYKYFTK